MNLIDLHSLPIDVRDDLISQVMRFLLERGYGIYAPGSGERVGKTIGSEVDR